MELTQSLLFVASVHRSPQLQEQHQMEPVPQMQMAEPEHQMQRGQEIVQKELPVPQINHH